MSSDSKDHRTKAELLEEIETLRWRLEEAEQTIEAIRHSDVDALVVTGPRGEQVYSITGAEHIYRVIVETMNEAAATVDPDGTVLFCNQRFCDLMNAPIKDVMGHKVTSFVARPQEATLKALLVDARTGAVQRRITLQAADGTPVPVQISASPLPTDGDVSVCVVASDLTELEASANSIRVLREHQQAVQESEARFRAIFESSRDAIVITNDEGVYVQANPAVEAIFGIPPKQLLGQRVSGFLREDIDFPTFWRDFLAAGRFHGEMPLIRADGQMRYIDVDAVTDILPGRHLSVIRDITERKLAREALESANEQLQIQTDELKAQTEELQVANEELSAREEELRVSNEALRQSETRYRELVENANSAIIRWTKDGIVTFFNEYAQAFFGYSEREAVGRRVDFLTPRQDSTGADLTHLAEDIVKHPQHYENHVNENICRDGRRVWMAWTNRPIYDENGRITEILAVGTDVTERKRAEEALRRLSQFPEENPNPVLRVAGDGTLLYTNRPARDWLASLGWEADGPLPVAVRALAADAGTQDQAVEREIGNPEGALLWVAASRPAGEDYVNIYGRDITARRRVEEALRREQGLLDSIMRTTDVMLVFLDPQFNFVWVNPAYAETCRMKPEEIVGKNHFALYPDPENEAIFRKVRDTGEGVFYKDKPFAFPDQPERGVTYWDWSLTPAKDDAGSVTGLVFTLRETTRFKQAEEALRESEDRYHRLFEDDLTGNFLCTPEGEILLCNPAFARIFGFSTAMEAVGTNISQLYIDPEEHQPLLERLTEERKIERLEVWRKRRNGEPIYVVENLVGRFNEYAELDEIKGYTFDDTDRKRAEEALRELNRTLESKVAERTAQLQHRAGQLQKLALELSETEDRERGRLAEILHDDLQQVLAAAKFHLNLVRHRAKGDPSQQATAAQVDHLLKEAIDKSRSLSHELSPAVLHHGDLSETLEWLAEQIQTKHGLVVHVNAFSKIDVQSEAIRAFLYKAAQELLFNVVKHARVNEARIRIRRWGQCICLSVTDRGRGFDPKNLREAAGFGLFSIRERIELLGGRMRIKSVPGLGSTFHIIVPDGQEAVDRELKAEEAASRAGQEPSAALERRPAEPRMRVLLADDHAIVREGLISLLSEEHTIEVVGEAANGREAVDLADRLRPDVVIMDVAMPLIDGDEATRQIKRHLPRTRVIALSMYEEHENVEKMLRAGAERYILKTAPSEELLAAIRSGAPSR